MTQISPASGTFAAPANGGSSAPTADDCRRTQLYDRSCPQAWLPWSSAGSNMTRMPMKAFFFALVLAITAIGNAAAAPPDGTWMVFLPGDAGWKCNVDWFIRLRVAQGQLSGVHVGDLEGAKSVQTIEHVVLNPDRSFAGATSGITSSGLHGTAWSVSGQFSGDTVTVTTRPIIPGLCPGRTGQGTRSKD
jgi:hypothetical protein